MTVIEAVETVLRKAGRALHREDIADRILNGGLNVRIGGATPWETLVSPKT